jgi:uncharacterized membrane protein
MYRFLTVNHKYGRKLAARGVLAFLAALVAGIVNIAVCHFLARLVQGVGILLPGLVPAAVAAILPLILPRASRRRSPMSRGLR